MDTFTTIMCIVGIAFAIFGIFCLTKDRKLVGFYKSIGSFGRVYSYLLLCCLIGVILSVVYMIGGSTKERGAMVVCGIIALAGSVLMFFLLFRKCGDITKGRVLFDYLVISVGTTMRISLFIMRLFVKTWYVMYGPTEYTVDGQTVYLYPGSNVMYDCHGHRVGEANSSRTAAVMDR